MRGFGLFELEEQVLGDARTVALRARRKRRRRRGFDMWRRVGRDWRDRRHGDGRIVWRRLVGSRRNKPPHTGRRKDGYRRKGNDDYEPTRARRLFVYRVCIVFDAELALGESH